MIELPGLELAELPGDLPHLARLAAEGSVGLMPVPRRIGSGENSLGDSLLGKLAMGPAVTVARDASGLTYRRLSAGRTEIIILRSSIPGEAASFRRVFGEYAPLPGYRELWKSHDRFVGRLMAAEDSTERTFLLYSCPALRHPNPALPEPRLATVILNGSGWGGGVLYSPGTRRKGFITYNDLRQAILHTLNPASRPSIRLKPAAGSWRAVARSRRPLLQNYLVRWPLLTGYGYGLLGVILFLAAGWWLRLPASVMRVPAWLYLYLLTFPAAFSLESLLDPIHWRTIVGLTLALTAALFALCYSMAGRDMLRTLALIALFTVVLVCGDALGNGRLGAKSFLGYSVVTGGRFYGIGNESMGILLGAYIVAVSVLLPKLGRSGRAALEPAAWLIGLLLVLPCCGADVGGGITALLGLGMTNSLWLKEPLRLPRLARLGGVTLAFLALAGAWDLTFGRETPSHLGQLILAVQVHGGAAFLTMAGRKLAMNLGLLTQTPLTVVLIALLLAIPYLYRHPPAALRKFIAGNAAIASGFTGICLTALIGFLVNDSGIASAALTFMFGLGMLFAVWIRDRTGNAGPPETGP